MIEAYALFAPANEGIAQGYSAYRKDHRDKLRKYWSEFVIEEK